jgi:hypothetical protein
VALSDDLERIARAAQGFAGPGEELAAVLATEPTAGVRVYLCAYGGDGDRRSWLGLDDAGGRVRDRRLLREAVSIAALCELAEETAGGGRLEQLRSQLVVLRLTEAPEGIEEAEAAALELERVVGRVPRVASPAYLDEIGAATRKLEEALGEAARAPFAEAMKAAAKTVEELKLDVEAHYKLALDG